MRLKVVQTELNGLTTDRIKFSDDSARTGFLRFQERWSRNDSVIYLKLDICRAAVWLVLEDAYEACPLRLDVKNRLKIYDR